MKNNLYKLFKDYSITDCYALESESKEYAILNKLFKNINNKEIFLPLILANSVACYNLSSSSEEYWREFGLAAADFNFKRLSDIYLFFIDFLPESVGNNKKVQTKISKMKRLKPFLDDMYFKQTYYHKNMLLLSEKIATSIQSLFDDFITTYAVRMYAYGARIRFNKNVEFPYDFLFVIDSKLEELYERYDGDFHGNAKDFYLSLSHDLCISPMNLIVLLRKDYEKLMRFGISGK